MAEKVAGPYLVMMMNDERITRLLAARLAGEATEAELRELDWLLAQDASLQTQAQLLQHYFKDAPVHTSAGTEQALERTLARIRAGGSAQLSIAGRGRRGAWKWWSAAAAAILLLLGGAWALWKPAALHTGFAAFSPEKDTVRWLHRQNGKAIRAALELADGSKIWLNADSRLSYPEQFGPHSREVFLTGEAFFQVSSAPEKPFIVHLSKGTIRVLGTSFNVRAYDNEPVKTSVSTGKVAFIPKYTDARVPDTFYITPDEKVTWHDEDARPEKAVTSGEEDRAWTDGGLVFRDATLEDICRELERTFGKKVHFDSEEPRRYRMTGAFRNNSLSEILFYLSKSKNFRYTITDSTLLISE